MKRKIYLFISLFTVLFCLTGCIIKRDNLENVDIYTTVYPIEYLVDTLYGYNSKVSSIYPAEIDLNSYKLTKKQIEKYSKGEIFVYNGLSNEKGVARDLLNSNTNLKIIDVSQGLEYSYSTEELWLNPRDYLMMAHNVKNGIEEYINNKYIIEEIDKNYESLKFLISSIDAELETIPENAKDKNIIIASDALSFLEKYGFTLTNIDNTKVDIPSTVSQKAKRLVQEKTVKYIFILDNMEESELVSDLVKSGAQVVKIRSMSVKKESDKENGVNYKTMMQDFIDAIKKEVYEE